MSIRFNGSELKLVLAEAIEHKCRVALITDEGYAFFVAERGASSNQYRPKAIAYAQGFNPELHTLKDRWNLKVQEFGHRDFCDLFETDEPAFVQIMKSEDDLKLSPKAVQESMLAVAQEKSGS